MTPLLSWNPEYFVNEGVLDNHHQKLFLLLSTVYENVMNSRDVVCVRPLIDELSEHSTCYFTAVEKYMMEKGFQEIDAHIAKHREFTLAIETLKTNYHGSNLDVAEELIIVLGNWLLR